MAEGEDRGRDESRDDTRAAESSGDDQRSQDEWEYDPADSPESDDERAAESSGDDEPPEAETEYDPAESRGGDDEAGDDDDNAAADSREQERRQKDTPDEEETREPQKTDERDEGGDDEDEDEDDDRKGPPGPGRSFLLFFATALFLFIGFLFFSAAIAPTYVVALILAALWFVLAYYLLGRFTRNRRHLRFPIRLAFAGFVAAVLLWLVISTLTGHTANDQLVTGQRLSDLKPTARVPKKAPPNGPRVAVLLATGKFESAGAGSAAGQASYVLMPNDEVKVTIKGLDVTSGPTLHVFLATKNGKDVSAHKDLGSLKGNKGDQQYTMPKGTDPRQYKTVVIWCKFLGVPFARAETKAQ